MDKKKMLMVGPGRGHNILPIIKEFNKGEFFFVDFMCHSLEFQQIDYADINFMQIPKVSSKFSSKLRYIYFIIRHSIFGAKYDVLLLQGGLGLFELFLMLFVNAKVKIYNCWSNQIIDYATEKNLQGRVAKSILSFADYVFLNWYGIKERFEVLFPCWSNKSVLSFWGIDDFFFMPSSNNIESGFVENFLKKIPDNTIVCFWPRSFIRANRQDLVVKALSLLKDRVPDVLTNFVIYLWAGNVEDAIFRKEIETLIINCDLELNVKIVDHPFVSNKDIRIIENRSDFFIQISDHDILSTFIIEVLLQEKDIILSNIRPYQCLNDIFKMNLSLVNNDIESIADALKEKLINMDICDKKILELRRKICEENFKFSRNYPKLIRLMYSLVS